MVTRRNEKMDGHNGQLLSGGLIVGRACGRESNEEKQGFPEVKKRQSFGEVISNLAIEIGSMKKDTGKQPPLGRPRRNLQGRWMGSVGGKDLEKGLRAKRLRHISELSSGQIL